MISLNKTPQEEERKDISTQVEGKEVDSLAGEKKQSPFEAAKNIFKKPIVDTKSMGQHREERMRDKNMKKGYAYMAVSIVILIAYSISFLYPEMHTLITANSEIQSMQDKIDNYNDVVLPSLEDEKATHKAAYDIEYKLEEEALNKVFPKDTDKLGIVKRLENFATSINESAPPFEFNSISFGQEKKIGGYTVLPISTSIHSSKTNFDRFIQLVNLSGNLEGDIQIRLMEVSNINIRYRGIDPKTGEDNGVDFTVKLNAYSR